MSNVRTVKRSDEVRTRGCIRFEGKFYEPANPHSMIDPGHRVRVMGYAGKSYGCQRIKVRRIYPGWYYGKITLTLGSGEETWEEM